MQFERQFTNWEEWKSRYNAGSPNNVSPNNVSQNPRNNISPNNVSLNDPNFGKDP
jgi:hypothetical protein